MRRCVSCNARMRRYSKTSTGVGFGVNKSEIEIFGGRENKEEVILMFLMIRLL